VWPNCARNLAIAVAVATPVIAIVAPNTMPKSPAFS
jgi:hypothetical protein